MDKTPNLQILKESIVNDDLLNRLEKLSVFLENLVHKITEDDVPEENVSKIVDHIKLQKKIYEEAHELYDSIKEENINKEKADKSLDALSVTLEEYNNYKNK